MALDLFLLAIVVFARPTPLSVTVGFAVAAAGEAVRIWAAGHLHKNVELITSGPYRYTRNPLYLGRLLIFTGICVMSRLPYGTNLVLLLGGYLFFFVYYLPRKERVEGARLLRAHGERYADYARAVPALIPTVHRYPRGATGGWSSARLSANREPWMIVGLALLSGLLLWIAYFAPQGLLNVWLSRS